MTKLKKDIKWICIQPLTGGMYLGFENVIGHPAEYILSYPGLNDHKSSKTTGKRGHCGNEYNLTQYLRKNGRDVPRYEFQHGMFELTDNAILKPDAFTEDHPVLFDDIDIVCSVPVCAGLSALTMTDDTQKELKNCNMKFLAEYAIKVIKPKVYVFENAPGFMSEKGNKLRSYFEILASTYGYSITYFKTDTKLHKNCQRRPRTFVMFVKWSEDGLWERSPETPWYENIQLTLKDVLSQIPDTATYQDSLPVPLYENVTYIAYGREKFGNDWRKWFEGDVMNKIIANNLLDDFEKWCTSTDSVDRKFADRMLKHIEHIRECKAEGRGWWSASPRYYPELAPAIQSRTVYAMIHPWEDRLCSERDALTLMGMPYDFEMYGDFMSDGVKIGQNVPVKTAEWIANIAVNVLDHIEDERETYNAGETPHQGARFYDNTKQKEVY